MAEQFLDTNVLLYRLSGDYGRRKCAGVAIGIAQAGCAIVIAGMPGYEEEVSTALFVLVFHDGSGQDDSIFLWWLRGDSVPGRHSELRTK